MPVTYNKPSRYDYVSRKVFDKQVDRWIRKVAALKEEIRELEQKLYDLQTGQKSILDFMNRPLSKNQVSKHLTDCLCNDCYIEHRSNEGLD